MKILLILATVLFPLTIQAKSYQQISQLSPTIPGGPLFQDNYGQTVYLHDDYLFVTALLARPDATKDAEGVVYVYKKNKQESWVLVQTIITGGMSDNLGALTVKADNDWLFISCIGTPAGPIVNDVITSQDFTGSIQIYQFDKIINQYVWRTSIDRSYPALTNLSAIDPDNLVVPPNAPPPLPTTEQGAAFGISFDVCMKDEILLIGAPGQQHINGSCQTLINSGSVYAFKYHHGAWEFVEELTNPEGVSANDSFGGTVRIDQNYALIGNSSVFTNPRLNSNGSVYLFRWDGLKWKYMQKIYGDQPNTTPLFSPSFLGGNVEVADQFGTTISFKKGWAIVGAPWENLGTGTLKGAAYIYKLENVYGRKRLVFKHKIVSDDPAALVTGLSVAIDGDTAVVGDPTRIGPNNIPAQGGVIVYRKDAKDAWKKDTVLYDNTGFPFEFLGGGVHVEGDTIVAGTGSAVTAIMLDIFFSPSLLHFPLPLAPNKAVVWQQ